MISRLRSVRRATIDSLDVPGRPRTWRGGKKTDEAKGEMWEAGKVGGRGGVGEGTMVALTREHSFGSWLVAGFVIFGVLAAFWH